MSSRPKAQSIPQPPPRAPIQCACTSLKMTARVIGRAYDDALAGAGLNSTQYAILVNVGRYQPIAQVSLADHLGLERTSLYRAVALLEGQGLLAASSRDGGLTKVLELTGAGKDAVSRARPRWEKVQSSFVDSFGKRRWQDLLAALGEIRAHFSED
jgi:DNA-binding MarR family transcriptional regulator